MLLVTLMLSDRMQLLLIQEILGSSGPDYVVSLDLVFKTKCTAEWFEFS